MIQSIVITGVKYDVDATTRKYIARKIGRLDRFLPRQARKSVTAEVRLKEVNRDNGNKYEAEIVLHVPDKQLTAKDSTFNMLAAIDIVEAKIVSQLRKYKAKRISTSGRARSILSRFKRTYAAEL